jgi:tRNA uridine 5-carbamoylmethylation protein Kti12
MAPYQGKTYMGPELKQSLSKSLNYFIQVYNDRRADIDADARAAYEDEDFDEANELKRQSQEIQSKSEKLQKYRQ